jgi:hypothetical protein
LPGWYDLLKDLVLPGFVGAASIVVAITSLRISSSAHRLARETTQRAEHLDRLRRREAFGRVLQEYVRARIAARFRFRELPEQRDPADVLADAEIAVATVDERDRDGARYLLYDLAIKQLANDDGSYVDATAVRIMIETSTAAWVADPGGED